MRSISRVAKVSINTVTKLLVDAGEIAERFHDERAREVQAKRIQCDEIWSFCYAKAKNAAPGNEGRRHRWRYLDLDGDWTQIAN